jgi:hypothetical protein
MLEAGAGAIIGADLVDFLRFLTPESIAAASTQDGGRPISARTVRRCVQATTTSEPDPFPRGLSDLLSLRSMLAWALPSVILVDLQLGMPSTLALDSRVANYAALGRLRLLALAAADGDRQARNFLELTDRSVQLTRELTIKEGDVYRLPGGYLKTLDELEFVIRLLRSGRPLAQHFPVEMVARAQNLAFSSLLARPLTETAIKREPEPPRPSLYLGRSDRAKTTERVLDIALRLIEEATMDDYLSFLTPRSIAQQHRLSAAQAGRRPSFSHGAVADYFPAVRGRRRFWREKFVIKLLARGMDAVAEDLKGRLKTAPAEEASDESFILLKPGAMATGLDEVYGRLWYLRAAVRGTDEFFDFRSQADGYSTATIARVVVGLGSDAVRRYCYRHPGALSHADLSARFEAGLRDLGWVDP